MHRPQRGRARLAARVVLLLALSAPAFGQADGSRAASAPHAELVARALNAHPDLRALSAEWRAAHADAAAARRATPQPRLSYTTSPMAVETRQGPQRHHVSLTQALPNFGARHALADADAARAAAIAERFDDAALRIAYDVRVAALDVARIDALADALQEQRQIAAEVAAHLDAVLPYVSRGAADLMRAELWVSILDDRLAANQAARDASLATLRALVRDDVALDASPQAVPLDDAAVDALAALDEAELVALARRENPAIALAGARRDAHLAAAEAARAADAPMPSVSMSWGVVERYDTPLPNTGDGGRDVFSVGVSVPIPVFAGQRRASEAAHQARADAESSRAESAGWTIEADVARTLARVRDAAARVRRYERELLPAAHDVADELAATMAHTDAHHTDVLLATQQELALRVSAIEARFTLASGLARLAWLTGGALDPATGARVGGDAPRVGIATFGDSP